MSKSLGGLIALVGVVLLSGAGNARAQGDDLQLPALAGARACVDTLVDQARKANFDIERHGIDNLILDPSRDNIQTLQQSTSKCMDSALPKVEVVTRPDGSTKSRVWYAPADGQYAWCATPAPTDDDVQIFGEEGSMKAWFALRLECAISDRISDWYDPLNLKPAEAKSADTSPPAAKVTDGRRVPLVSASKPGDCADAAVHWASAESIGTRQAYEDHLARFPNCAFATLAKVRIAAIEHGAAPPPRPLASTPPPAEPAPSAKNCPTGQVRDSDGDCVREREKATRSVNPRNPRAAAPARPRAAAENNEAPHALNCSDPAQVVACATKALSTLPH
jgi:hypothetical protein